MKLKTLLLAVTLSIIGQKIYAQQHYKLYAGFMYHFATKTQWPASKSSGDFVIGVIGDSPVTQQLKALANSRKIGSRKLVIKTFSSASAITGCHIVFIPSRKMSLLSAVTAKAKSSNMMVVTEQTGGAKKGAVISFVNNAGKVRFQLSKSKAAAVGLKLSADLVKLAILV